MCSWLNMIVFFATGSDAVQGGCQSACRITSHRLWRFAVGALQMIGGDCALAPRAQRAARRCTISSLSHFSLTVPYCPTVLHSGADQGNIRKLAKLVRGPPPQIATEKCQALVGFRCGLRDMGLPLRWAGPIIVWKSDTKVLGLRNTCDDFATQCVKASWKNTFTWQMHYVTFWDIEFKAPGFTPPVERFKVLIIIMGRMGICFTSVATSWWGEACCLLLCFPTGTCVLCCT